MSIKKIIKICALFLLITALFSVCAYAKDVFSNQVVDISCTGGKIVVSGSFDADSCDSQYYNVFFPTYAKNGMVKKVEISPAFTMKQGKNSFSASFDVTAKEQPVKAFLFSDKFSPICDPTSKTIKSLRILSIGNSFSIDAQEWLYGIAKDGGFDNVVLGNLYIGGCSLKTHYDNSVSGAAAYTFYKNSTGTWSNETSKTMDYGILYEDWDYITLQQSSGNSGAATSYEPYVSELIKYVNGKKTNPDAELVWHMTWAYDKPYAATSNYGSQDVMYSRIIGAVKEKIVPNSNFSMIIPAGTAIQNARTSYVGDNFNRDGYHLDYTYGRYLAGLTWFHKITGLPIDDIDYIPNGSFSKEYLEILKESAKNAVLKPFEVTQSSFVKVDEEEIEYTELDWEPENNSYYNSTSTDPDAKKRGDSISARFISSRIFTKEELPVGTVIEVDAGYAYRPEAWIDLDTPNTSATRPVGVTAQRIVVDEAWWGNFNYRAFNLYLSNNANISGQFDEAVKHFRIYVPILKEDDGEDTPSGYIDWEPMKNLYYNSLGSSTPSTNDGNKNRFICSKIFTRAELPVGTVIEVDAGYQYRPEGWVDLNTKNTVRPDNVTTSRVVVDEAWWGNYNYRAFNLSKTNLSDVCTNFEESCTHFRIYIP